MVIVIITDSLGLPRVFPEIVLLNETYIELLRQQFPEHKILSLSIGGATLQMLQNQFFAYYKSIEPNLVIMQAGIVDCAPRALKTWELKLLTANSMARKFYELFIKKNIMLLRKKRRITYTPLATFREIIEKYNRELRTNIYWLGIVPADESYEEQVPGIRRNIEEYNKVLRDVLGGRFVDLADMPVSGVMSDHHHLTKEGHWIIFQKIKKIIESYTINKPGT